MAYRMAAGSGGKPTVKAEIRQGPDDIVDLGAAQPAPQDSTTDVDEVGQPEGLCFRIADAPYPMVLHDHEFGALRCADA